VKLIVCGMPEALQRREVDGDEVRTPVSPLAGSVVRIGELLNRSYATRMAPLFNQLKKNCFSQERE
jgi:hypothetical protein